MVFSTLAVRENLVATAANRLCRMPARALDRVMTLFPRLRERAKQIGGTLSGGEQQMLAIGRALMANPKLLILDEATEGLAPLVRADIWRCIEALKREGQSPDRGHESRRAEAARRSLRHHREGAHSLATQLRRPGQRPRCRAPFSRRVRDGSDGNDSHCAHRAR